MSFRRNLRRARSHLIIVVVLIVAGTLVVRIEDRNLNRETGKAIPQRSIAAPR